MYRITNKVMEQTMLSDLHSNLARLLTMQEQLASGRKYANPSDSPTDVARVMGLDAALSENEQYTENLEKATSWLSNTETAFDQMTSVTQRIRELTIYAGNGALEGVDAEAIASEIEQLKEELMSIANYSVAGTYLLGGTEVTDPPFYVDSSGNVQYRGTDNAMEFEIDEGVVGQVSFTGREVFPEEFTRYVLESVDVPMDF